MPFYIIYVIDTMQNLSYFMYYGIFSEFFNYFYIFVTKIHINWQNPVHFNFIELGDMIYAIFVPFCF
jgi:hypothetical protein